MLRCKSIIGVRLKLPRLSTWWCHINWCQGGNVKTLEGNNVMFYRLIKPTIDQSVLPYVNILSTESSVKNMISLEWRLTLCMTLYVHNVLQKLQYYTMHGYFTGTLKNETTMSSIVRKPRTCEKIFFRSHMEVEKDNDYSYVNMHHVYRSINMFSSC